MTSRRPPIYDRLAASYDSMLAPLERWFLSRWRKETLALLPEQARLLEVGAGTGLNFPFYPRATLSAASELSFEMLRVARGKERPGAVRLVQASAETLPFPDASFDAAFATLVFCSLASPRAAFLELGRVVRPGGTIVLLEHVRPPGLLGYFFDALNLLTVPLFEDHFNRRTALEAERAGLRLQEVKRRALGIINLIVCRVGEKDEG